MNRKEEIRKELAEIAPFLAKLEPTLAFKVPKGYFDELPETILESVSPLAALKKEPAFTVPKNYFESLPDLVLDRVAPKPVTETVAEPASSSSSSWLDDLINSVAVLFQPRYALRLATVAMVLVAAVFFIQNQNADNGMLVGITGEEQDTEEITLDDLNAEDLAYLLGTEETASLDNLDNVEDALLDELLEDLDDLSDEDLEGLL